MFRIILSVLFLFITMQSYAAVIIGNPKGNVTLVEVYDYQCPHCHQAFPVVMKLIAHNSNLKIRLMPVAILNQQSLYEAAAAIASTRYRGMFQVFTSIVMSEPPLSSHGVVQTLDRLGLTSTNYIKIMHSSFVKNQMMEGLKLLQQYHSGTPLFIIQQDKNANNNIVLRGYESYHIMQKAINEVSHAS